MNKFLIFLLLALGRCSLEDEVSPVIYSWNMIRTNCWIILVLLTAIIGVLVIIKLLFMVHKKQEPNLKSDLTFLKEKTIFNTKYDFLVERPSEKSKLLEKKDKPRYDTNIYRETPIRLTIV
ncbi:unnamed protein product [Blepharisma stoltei]|uniref:Uncharacterized protein n=1 Tax=Blepharisma stoltei TaxID=1481888 RepID=A0AAU9KB48_9CILI|nr:unnamed protein product [Blepharisma stoltei]